MKAERFYDLLALFERAKCLVTVDTAHLHLAYACPTLPVVAIIGANPRTILLGLSMIAGSPLWFFLIELVALNLVLAFAIMQAAASGRRIARLIAAGGD